jgi:Holliday junction resolvasome RuvABC endonuclease subunit
MYQSLVFGVDPMTDTGWALALDGAVRESGVQSFRLERGESNGMRYLRFNRWLQDISCTFPDATVKLICYEESFQVGRHASELYNGFVTRLQEFAVTNGFECTHVHTGQLKKWATGRGNANKPEMIRAAMLYLNGRELATVGDDEADAVLLAMYAVEHILGKE